MSHTLEIGPTSAVPLREGIQCGQEAIATVPHFKLALVTSPESMRKAMTAECSRPG